MTYDSGELMHLAVEKARQGIAAGQTPFGCAIAREGQLLAVAHNTVWQTTDITAHAEVNALRDACREAGNIHLEGCIVATTCEPCPMCMAALHWARVATVYYGATIADATAAGFNELAIPAQEVLRRGQSGVKLLLSDREAECKSLFSEWKKSQQSKTY